jgi:hypothetical protein
MQRSFPPATIPGIDDARSVIDELASHDNVIAIILFGSVARGQARKISDIDLCVITGKNVPEYSEMDLLSYGSERIDVSLFHRLPITIKFRVIREGKVLACRDILALHAIMADTTREYLDIAPFIRRNCNRILGIAGGA